MSLCIWASKESACSQLTQELKTKQSTDSMIAKGRVILEALGVGVAMAAVLIPGEILNGKYPDPVLFGKEDY